jgi:hypothetical protein
MDGGGDEASDELFDGGDVVQDDLVEEAELEFFVELLSEHYLLGDQGKHSQVGTVGGSLGTQVI